VVEAHLIVRAEAAKTGTCGWVVGVLPCGTRKRLMRLPSLEDAERLIRNMKQSAKEKGSDE